MKIASDKAKESHLSLERKLTSGTGRRIWFIPRRNFNAELTDLILHQRSHNLSVVCHTESDD